MTRKLIRLWRCDCAATAAEFTMVAPLLIFFLFTVIDVGRFMWAMNQGEKATQFGARFAIVTDPVSPGLIDADFAGGSIEPGDLIPASALGELVCTSSTCTCTGACSAISGTAVDADAFNAIVQRMQVIMPRITAANVRVIYRGSGFGFAAGAPTGGGGATETMEISPLVTVRLSGVAFNPLTLPDPVFSPITLPAFSTTLPAEDASGAVSN